MVTIARRPAPPRLLQRLRAERAAAEGRSGPAAETEPGAAADRWAGAATVGRSGATTEGRSGAVAGGTRAAGGGGAAAGDDLPPDLLSPDCPTRRVLDRIGDKWTVLVVLLLSDGPMRFSELRNSLGQVAPKVLTQTLRRMERDGLLTRQVFAEVPPRVEYALTALGHSLITPIATIADWAETNVGRITAAQVAYDAGQTTS